MEPADACAMLFRALQTFSAETHRNKLLLALDRDVFFEIEFCGFVTKCMTVGHVVCFLAWLNPAEPIREAAQSLMVHASYVLV